MAVIISYFGWPQTIAFKMPHNIQFERRKKQTLHDDATDEMHECLDEV